VSIQGELNRIAETSGLDAQGAANLLAGTSGKEFLGALNAIVGTQGKGLVFVCNQIALLFDGVGGSDPLGALRSVPSGSRLDDLVYDNLETEAGEDLMTELGGFLFLEAGNG